MKFPTYDDIVKLRAEQHRASARKRLTEMLCSGGNMRDAIAALMDESASLIRGCAKS